MIDIDLQHVPVLPQYRAWQYSFVDSVFLTVRLTRPVGCFSFSYVSDRCSRFSLVIKVRFISSFPPFSSAAERILLGFFKRILSNTDFSASLSPFFFLLSLNKFLLWLRDKFFQLKYRNLINFLSLSFHILK